MTRLVSHTARPDGEGWQPAKAPFEGAFFRLRVLRASECKRSPVADIVDNRVKQLSAKFEAGKMLHFTISERDGTKWIIDGNHRWTILNARGLLGTHIQAIVYRGLTEEGERLMWEILEDKMGKRPIEFMASRASRGVEPDKTIWDAFTKHRVNIRRVTAIRPVQRALAETSPAALQAAVAVVGMACPSTGKLQGHLVHALALVVRRYHGSGLDYRRLARVLAGADPAKLSGEGTEQYQRSHHAHSQAQFIAQKLVYLYNKRKRVDPLPEWEWGK